MSAQYHPIGDKSNTKIFITVLADQTWYFCSIKSYRNTHVGQIVTYKEDNLDF